MGSPGQTSEALIQAQIEGSAENNIAPPSINSQSLRPHIEGTGSSEWQYLNLLSLDGGGIRGYWSLLALEKLMDCIGLEEGKEEIDHSFDPCDWPDQVCQAPLTTEEEESIKSAWDTTEKLRRTPRTRRYLPCHYFDYICGSSTGALIAIMLGRFRMTVPDCLFEYRRLGQEVFGKPRMISTLRFGLGDRHKYKAARLEKVFKNVTRRRNEQLGASATGKIYFPLGRGLCATSVTTIKSEEDGRSGRLHLIRSYDHEMQDSPHQSRGPTPGSTMRSDRTNTDISQQTDGTQRRRERRQKIDGAINYEKAQQLEVWQVARAATAARFYFEPLKVENAVGGFATFEDGGFGRANNPTRTGKQEIEDLNGKSSVGIVVSVGTARKLKKDAKKATFFSTIPNAAREFADTVTDPEDIHRDMKRDVNSNKFPYYRLNDPGGLQTELDEWEPKHKVYNEKQGGAKTIDDMESAFAKWAAKLDNIEQLKECAAALVSRRKGRTLSPSTWERYATGSHFICRQRCVLGDFNDRDEFTRHLKKSHDFEEGIDLEEELKECRRHWRYQAAPKESS